MALVAFERLVEAREVTFSNAEVTGMARVSLAVEVLVLAFRVLVTLRAEVMV